MAEKSPHVGMHTHRLKQNPWEEHFAKRWQEANERKPGRPTSTLAYLLNPPTRDYDHVAEPSEHDAEVAATVIQWLGSQVGHAWPKETIESLPAKRFKD